MSIGGFAIIERGLVGAGLVLLAISGGALTDRAVSSRLALREFDQQRAAVQTDSPPPAAEFGREEIVDFSIWSESRVRAYSTIISTSDHSPLAVLRIEKANIRVPVFQGTDQRSLNRGVGWISGTARPGQAGNIGIAGHRDGAFRRLKDISPGDLIELSTLAETAVYTVERTEIVTPENVSVLKPGKKPVLTLVTCYPFYFVGNAPKRYIVHASLTERRSQPVDNRFAPARARKLEYKEISR